MPKTASKRTQARKIARVQRAHQEAATTPVVRRPPAKRRTPGRRGGLIGAVRSYPWLTTFLVLALAGGGALTAHAKQVGPFAPPKPVAAACVAPQTRHWTQAPAMTINTSYQYTATIKTPRGTIVVALEPKTAPNAVNNFVFLADQNYYCDTYFWRVETPGKPSPIDGQPSQLSLIQGGSVATTGQDPTTEPGYTIKDDKVVGGYTPGTVAMANTGKPNTASAQFFIDIGNETKYFTPTYTIFGHVTAGMSVVTKITPGDLIQGVTIAVKK